MRIRHRGCRRRCASELSGGPADLPSRRRDLHGARAFVVDIGLELHLHVGLDLGLHLATVVDPEIKHVLIEALRVATVFIGLAAELRGHSGHRLFHLPRERRSGRRADPTIFSAPPYDHALERAATHLVAALQLRALRPPGHDFLLLLLGQIREAASRATAFNGRFPFPLRLLAPDWRERLLDVGGLALRLPLRSCLRRRLCCLSLELRGRFRRCLRRLSFALAGAPSHRRRGHGKRHTGLNHCEGGQTWNGRP
mmetsp:Transcript_87238/g.244829  ORF Transcript_87238/g.244829 Transcript_87238/m.244829 type:complete len:254 (-) Transcript_87238:7-768(-)